MFFTVLLYFLVSLFGRSSVWRFVQGIAPSQAVAFSIQSSLASLPSMIEGAETRLGAVPQVVGLVLPLAVLVFRYNDVHLARRRGAIRCESVPVSTSDHCR